MLRIVEEFDPEFKVRIENFKMGEMPHVYFRLEKYKNKDVTVFSSGEEADEYLLNFKGE